MLQWIKRKLGIERLEREISRINKLEWYTLADVVDKLEDSMVIIAGDNMMIKDLNMIVPNEKKQGILILGSHNTIMGSVLRGQKIKTTMEYVEETPSYHTLSETTKKQETK